MQNIQRISSNWTLLLKIFLPTFWFVFYGAIVIALFMSPLGDRALAGNGQAIKYGVLLFYISGSIVLYFTLMQLKRVEYDVHFLYISNYFTTIRIPWHNVDRIHDKKILFVQSGTITFIEAVSFGKHVHFLASRSLLRLFYEAHPEYSGSSTAG